MITDESPMPNGVDELFCPPDGAMQFEVFRTVQKGELEIHALLWVGSPFPYYSVRAKMDGCNCAEFYDVLHIINKREIGFSSDGSPLVVCACIGKLVE